VTSFLVDAQLPPALTRWIASTGYDCKHVGDLNLATASDDAIWRYAARTNSVIVTKDEDFAQRKSLAKGGPAIVWIRWPNTRRRELLTRFAAVFPDVLITLQRGETLIEIV
jgi:predicted nuclease of predicted toxin-antitoxin system